MSEIVECHAPPGGYKAQICREMTENVTTVSSVVAPAHAACINW